MGLWSQSPRIPSPPNTQDVNVLMDYVKQLANITAILAKDLEFIINGTVDSSNIREIAGYNVSQTELKHKSGIVGMNGGDPQNPNAIRFWAGNADPTIAPFRVQQNGKMFATDGEFEGKITATSGKIGGFTITNDALTADAGGRIENHADPADKVYLDDTGLHANDETGIERITIGTTPAKGAKAIVTRDDSGAAQGVYVYDTETVDGAIRTGQYITAHGVYVLLGNDGLLRMQDVSGRGFRTQGSGVPEMNDGFGWTDIAKKVDTDARGFTLSYDSGTKLLTMSDRNGNTLSNVILT